MKHAMEVDGDRRTERRQPPVASRRLSASGAENETSPRVRERARTPTNRGLVTTAAAAAIAAAPTATAAAAATAFGFRPRFVDGQRPALDFLAVQPGDGSLSFLVGAH